MVSRILAVFLTIGLLSLVAVQGNSIFHSVQAVSCEGMILYDNSANQYQKIDSEFPLPVKERIGIYAEQVSLYDAVDGDEIFLLKTPHRSFEIESIQIEYGYRDRTQLEKMGTPEDILRYFGQIWDTKSKSEKNDDRNEWYVYWNPKFPAYAKSMYAILGSLLSEAGTPLVVHDSQETCEVEPTYPVSIDVIVDGKEISQILTVDGTSVTAPVRMELTEGIHFIKADISPDYSFNYWDFSTGISFQELINDQEIAFDVQRDGTVTLVLDAVSNPPSILGSVTSKEMEITNIVLNRNPVQTTPSGLEISKPLGIAEPEVVSFGVWARVTLQNNSTVPFDGEIRGYLVGSDGDEINYLGKHNFRTKFVPVYSGGIGEMTVDVPIFFSGQYFENEKLTILLELGQFPSHLKIEENWEVVDSKEFSLLLVDKIVGPAHIGKRVPIIEVLEVEGDTKGVVRSWAEILVSYSAGGVSVAGGHVALPLQLNDIFPSYRISDTRLISEIFSKSTVLTLEQIDYGPDTFSLKTISKMLDVPVQDYPFWFSHSFDRVLTQVIVPPVLLVTSHDAPVEIQDGKGNTILLWIDNYNDKLFKSNVEKSHSFVVGVNENIIDHHNAHKLGLDEPRDYDIVVFAYYEMGPYDGLPSKHKFNVVNYDKWSSNPDDSFWLITAFDMAHTIIWVEPTPANQN